MKWRYTEYKLTMLKDYLINDQAEHYFIIGRAFNPHDDSLSESVIADTILLEFKCLYPIYNHIRALVSKEVNQSL